MPRIRQTIQLSYQVNHSKIIMPISFAKIAKEVTYSRQTLAELWGYASFHAIARGVVTPRNDNKIVLFVTEEKQSSAEQYADRSLRRRSNAQCRIKRR